MTLVRGRRSASALDARTRAWQSIRTPAEEMNRMRTLHTAALLALLTPAAALAQYGNGRAVQFTVRVENVSTPQTLKLSNGTTAPAPTAPILWTITDDGNPLFTPERVDRGLGLERLAEEGNPGVLADYIRDHM